MKKPSFLERLTGSQSDEYDRILDEDHEFGEDDDNLAVEEEGEEYSEEESWEDEQDTASNQQDGELPVDLFIEIGLVPLTVFCECKFKYLIFFNKF